MAGYKEIKGFQVQTRTEDPSPTEAQTGDFYYNSSTGQFKNVFTGVGSFSSGGSLNTARYSGYRAGGTPSGLVSGGLPGSPPSATAITESYNGTSYTEVADLNTATSV